MKGVTPLTVKVVVDSALNIPQDIVTLLDIAVVPVNIVIDGETYREGVDASRSLLVTKIGQSKQLGTSQPSPGDFLTVYEHLGGEIVSIHIAARSSGTYQSACLAATMATKAKVVTVDSEQVALGGGWQAIAAALKAKQKATVEEVVEAAEQAKAEVSTFLTVPTLKYLSRSGRVNFAKALIASLLSVKPIMGINAGLVEVVSKSRSMPGALKEMVSLLKEKYGQRPLAVAIMHAEDPGLASQLQLLAEKELKVAHLLVTDLTASLVVHGGPGTVAISVIPMEYVSGLKAQ
ncbi:MAG: DegV domain-containing protein [Firmicutes bacterium]|nr:DegV domain-containing protein [Bacillota bacterium]